MNIEMENLEKIFITDRFFEFLDKQTIFKRTTITFIFLKDGF